MRDCFFELRKNGATGVDKVDFKSYEENLRANISALVERLKRKSYRANLIKRVYIPKGDGKFRPLGIPTLEDKMLQRCVAKILNAMYEPIFRPTSYGFRPRIGALTAVSTLSLNLNRGKFGWVIDADIEAFFDNINHDKLIEMLELKINDSAFIRLIRKWLKAGILDTDGKVLHPITGTPQGGIVSPILSNIYLHYVLDLWYEKVVKTHCQSDSNYIRYADDTVWVFRFKSDALAVQYELKKRLEKFGLKLSETKTKLLKFSRFGKDKNERFDFLGFEFYWGISRKTERPTVKKRTSRKKLYAAVQNFKDWIRKNRHKRITKTMKTLSRKLHGYWNYYGVPGNYDSLNIFYCEVLRSMHKWLNRRSGRKSYNWRGLKDLFNDFSIPRPRITQV